MKFTTINWSPDVELSCDMYLCHVESRDNTWTGADRWWCWFPFLKRVTGERYTAMEGPRFKACLGTFTPRCWREAPTDYQTLDSGEVWLSSRPAKGFTGVCPPSLHAFCGSVESLWLYSPKHSVRVRLGAMRHNWNWTKYHVLILYTKLSLFPALDGLCQGCTMSQILFVVFMNRIWRCSCWEEGDRLGILKVSSLFSVIKHWVSNLYSVTKL